MLFADYFFLIWFLPLFFGLYFVVPKKAKNPVLLLGSMIFYVWIEPRYFFVLLIGLVLDYYLVRRMGQLNQKKALLALVLALNLAFLLYFKYVNFFLPEDGAGLLQRVALPLGISFFTFQKLSYAIDVYRNEKRPVFNLMEYCIYILLFPQLVMGPIIRYKDIATQIQNREEKVEDWLAGFFRFVIGLSRKVLIANPIFLEVEKIFILGEQDLTGELAWIALLGFTFFIYFDFSGYADMAIGLGRMLGFRFPENFNNPMISRTATEFWQRWHITLGHWMRDYLYRGLRGLKGGRKRLYLNLWIVFMLIAVWHGSTLNFVLWGVYYGFWIVLERRFLKAWIDGIARIWGMAYNFFIACFGIGLFHLTSISQLSLFYKRVLFLDFAESPRNLNELGINFSPYFFFLMALAAVFSFVGALEGVGKWQDRVLKLKMEGKWLWIWTGVGMVLLILCISQLGTFGFQPFLYEKF